MVRGLPEGPPRSEGNWVSNKYLSPGFLNTELLADELKSLILKLVLANDVTSLPCKNSQWLSLGLRPVNLKYTNRDLNAGLKSNPLLLN